MDRRHLPIKLCPAPTGHVDDGTARVPSSPRHDTRIFRESTVSLHRDLEAEVMDIVLSARRPCGLMDDDKL